MDKLKDILSKYKEAIIDLPITITNKYHEDVYHIDDLIDSTQHDKIFSVGSKVFSLTINLTQNTFILKRLCADTVTGIVTDKDKTYLLLLISSKLSHTL